MESVYLDHNATAPVLPEVAEAMAAALRTPYGNPASPHEQGRRARRALEQAREGIAELLGADLAARPADRVLLTSGGTEANNLALFGLTGHEPGELIVSAIEHSSVLGPAAELERRGWTVHRLLPAAAGAVSPDDLAQRLTDRTRLVSVMLGNNETGVLQPVAELSALCAARNVPLHTDAAQAVGKQPVHFRSLGVAALTVAAHKLHGPLGIGALLLRGDVALTPLARGGAQQEGLRPGTESVALALGFHAALAAWHREGQERGQRLAALRDRLETGLRSCWPRLVVNGRDGPRLPHVANVGFVGLDRQALLMALDQAGVAASTGSACASGSSRPSPVLLAMGCPRDVVDGAIRFSLGATTTAAEVDLALLRIAEVCRRLAP